MSKKNFFDMSKEERQKTFWEMSDENIDFSDIPEINQDFVKTLKRIENDHKLQTDTVRIKSYLLNWFKNNAQENSYEVLINNVLENYIRHQTES